MEFGFEDATEATDGVDPTLESKIEPSPDPRPDPRPERRPRQVLLPEIRVHDTVVGVCFGRLHYGLVLDVLHDMVWVLFVKQNRGEKAGWHSQSIVRKLDTQQVIKTAMRIHAADVFLTETKHVQKKLQGTFRALQNSPR